MDASVAQLGEQRFCKPQVVGSSPSAGFFTFVTVEVQRVVLRQTTGF